MTEDLSDTELQSDISQQFLFGNEHHSSYLRDLCINYQWTLNLETVNTAKYTFTKALKGMFK